MSLENLHKAALKSDLNQVKFLLESNNVKKGSFRLALQSCIKDKKNRNEKINKEIFSLILDYNVKNSFIDDKDLLNAFKDAMAAKDSFFLKRLLKYINLHSVVSEGFSLNKNNTINNLVTLFYMAGRFNKTENVKVLIQHNDIENICGYFNSESYQNFILLCLEKFVYYGNAPSYLYFFEDFLIDKSKIIINEHIEYAIRNKFTTIVDKILPYSNLNLNDFENFLCLAFSKGQFSIFKKIMNYYLFTFEDNINLIFQKMFSNASYPFIDKDFFTFIKYLDKEKLFSIDKITIIINKSKNKYKKESFNKQMLKSKIDTF